MPRCDRVGALTSEINGMSHTEITLLTIARDHSAVPRASCPRPSTVDAATRGELYEALEQALGPATNARSRDARGMIDRQFDATVCHLRGGHAPRLCARLAEEREAGRTERGRALARRRRAAARPPRQRAGRGADRQRRGLRTPARSARRARGRRRVVPLPVARAGSAAVADPLAARRRGPRGAAPGGHRADPLAGRAGRDDLGRVHRPRRDRAGEPPWGAARARGDGGRVARRRAGARAAGARGARHAQRAGRGARRLPARRDRRSVALGAGGAGPAAARPVGGQAAEAADGEQRGGTPDAFSRGVGRAHRGDGGAHGA
mgnify:CR=1 FL=1